MQTMDGLYLDEVYVYRTDGWARFWRVNALTGHEFARLSHTIVRRIGHFPERQGLPGRDCVAAGPQGIYTANATVMC